MKIFLTISAGVTLLVFFVLGVLSYQASHSTTLGSEVRFIVKPGDDVFSLSERLANEGIIVSRAAFLWESVKERKHNTLVAGEYEFGPNDTIEDIIYKVAAGDAVSRDYQLTFPEGFRLTQIAERLSAVGLPGEEVRRLAENPDPALKTEYPFLASLPAGMPLEGYLFPDTYRFDPEASAEEIVGSMLSNFGDRLTPALLAEVNRQGKTLHEIVTMASLIEEEARYDGDRPMISDIFWKRLAIDQPLQSDATINYINNTLKDQSSLADLESESPYNTYKFPGLPPGPISSPGLKSLEAAVYPESNPYYYFLHDLETRETVYARTFEEHKENRAKHGL